MVFRMVAVWELRGWEQEQEGKSKVGSLLYPGHTVQVGGDTGVL